MTEKTAFGLTTAGLMAFCASPAVLPMTDRQVDLLTPLATAWGGLVGLWAITIWVRRR